MDNKKNHHYKNYRKIDIGNKKNIFSLFAIAILLLLSTTTIMQVKLTKAETPSGPPPEGCHVVDNYPANGKLVTIWANDYGNNDIRCAANCSEDGQDDQGTCELICSPEGESNFKPCGDDTPLIYGDHYAAYCYEYQEPDSCLLKKSDDYCVGYDKCSSAGPVDSPDPDPTCDPKVQNCPTPPTTPPMTRPTTPIYSIPPAEWVEEWFKQVNSDKDLLDHLAELYEKNQGDIDYFLIEFLLKRVIGGPIGLLDQILTPSKTIANDYEEFCSNPGSDMCQGFLQKQLERRSLPPMTDEEKDRLMEEYFKQRELLYDTIRK
jgi:hypothetical protein